VGALDLSRNIYEWTSTRYDDIDYSQGTLDYQGLFPCPYRIEDGREAGETLTAFNRRGSEQSLYTMRVLRGGSFYNTSNDLRSAYRGWETSINGISIYGFRCARFFQ
jgi:formylglycine-generating enzyme required for sulfatase activity